MDTPYLQSTKSVCLLPLPVLEQGQGSTYRITSACLIIKNTYTIFMFPDKTAECMEVLVSEFANQTAEYIRSILVKAICEGGEPAEKAVELLSVLSQS